MRGRSPPRGGNLPAKILGEGGAGGGGRRGRCRLGEPINRSGAVCGADRAAAAALPAGGPGRARHRRQAPAGPALCCRDNRVARRAGSQAGSEGRGLAAAGHVRRARGGAAGPGPGGGMSAAAGRARSRVPVPVPVPRCRWAAAALPPCRRPTRRPSVAGPPRPSCTARRAVMRVPRSAGGGECPAERRGVSQRRGGGRAGGRAMESSAPRRREGRAV